MLLPHIGFICKSNSDETIERLTLSNNIKQMKSTGQFVMHHEFFKMKSENKRTWRVALGVMKHRIATSRVLT